MISIDQIETAEQIKAARALVREFMDYALTLDPEAKSASTFAGLIEQLANLPGIFRPPRWCVPVGHGRWSSVRLCRLLQSWERRLRGETDVCEARISRHVVGAVFCLG